MADAHGPLPSWISPATWLAARVYGVAVACRNARLDRGTGVRRLEVDGVRPPVASVGNLTAGGTGKSPFVAWAARELAAAGASPVIAMRGYRGAPDGRGGLVSDEALEYGSTAPDARIVVGARRREALERALHETGGARDAVVVLDDGFQHRMLARDLDVVLVDATRPGLDGDLLPNGWLREPAQGIARAGLVVLTKADDGDARARAAASVRRWRGMAHDASCVHDWTGLEVFGGPGGDGSASRATPVRALEGVRVVSACALGNPAHFHAMVERAGARIAVRLEKADHRAFAAEELESAARRAGATLVVASRKDLVKLVRMPAVELAVPRLGLRFLEGEDRVRAALASLVSARGARA